MVKIKYSYFDFALLRGGGAIIAPIAPPPLYPRLTRRRRSKSVNMTFDNSVSEVHQVHISFAQAAKNPVGPRPLWLKRYSRLASGLNQYHTSRLILWRLFYSGDRSTLLHVSSLVRTGIGSDLLFRYKRGYSCRRVP
jgi:hypothetical protein